MKKFILSIIRKIESLENGIIAYAYVDENLCWVVALSDYDFYMKNERFKALSKAWHKAIKARKRNICFVYCNPIEKNLLQLSEENNLIMNI